MKLRLIVFLVFITNFTIAQIAETLVLPEKQLNARYSVSLVNINTRASDFSPFLFHNRLYFVSNRNENLAVAYTGANNQNTSDLFYCTKIDSNTFSKPKPFLELNSAFDDGPVMLGPSSNYAVFSASNAKGKLQIYFSIFENGKWSKPILHPISRSGSSYCHPFLCSDAKTLFFCSDRDGGYGGMDIYYSKLENLNWSNPINLGPKINTAANELFPFISSDNQLYFSTKRKEGRGDLDIYSYSLKDSLKSTIRLLESPINSSADDFGFCIDSTLKSGYFSSNREDEKDDNIYFFSKQIPEFVNCIPAKKNNCYSFYKDSYSLSDSAKQAEYEWDLGDGNKIRARAVKHCYDKPGFYNVKLSVVEKESGKLMYIELAYTIAVRPQGLQIDANDSLFTNTPVAFDASSSQLEGYSIVNYNWIFNDTNFSKGPKANHIYKENGIYLVELGVEALNLVTKQLKKFCMDKWILVGDRAYLESNLKHFKYAELLPDADEMYFEMDTGAALSTTQRSKVFHYKGLKEDAFSLNGSENEDLVLNALEQKLRAHKFTTLGADGSSLENLSEEDIALLEQEQKIRSHKYTTLNADGSSLENLSEEEVALLKQQQSLRTHKYSTLNADSSALESAEERDALLRAKQRLMRFKNALLPPIVDTVYFPKETDETIYRVNLGLSDSKVDKTSGVFDGIKKLEETKEGNRYRYTSGKEKNFASIVPYYENAKQKGFKDAEVVGFTNESIKKGQAKNLKAVLFDSALVENHALKIYFKYNVASYDRFYNKQLDSLISKTASKENQKILLITHFDGIGNEEYNINLNNLRTNNMINYLVSKGVKKSLIKTEFIIHPTEKLEPDLLRRIEVFLVN